MHNIAIIGKMGSGKTTVAKYLSTQHKFARVHFATPVKRIANTLWDKPTRGHYQQLGEKMREIDPDIWVKKFMQNLDAYQTAFPDDEPDAVVVDDCRYPNEYYRLKVLGWYVLEVKCEEGLRVDRLMRDNRLGNNSQLRHPSETALDSEEQYPRDYVVYNDSSEALLHTKIEAVLERILYV